MVHLNGILAHATLSSASCVSNLGCKAALKPEALGGGLNLRKKIEEREEYLFGFRTVWEMFYGQKYLLGKQIF